MWRDTARVWAEAIDDWTTWMESASYAAGTVQQRRWQLRGLAETYLQRPPWRLSTEDLMVWMSSRGWGPSTLKTARAALRSFYGWGVSSGRAKSDPALGLPRVRVPAGLPRPADAEVVAKALGRGSDRDRLMILLGVFGGLRAAEIAGLRWADVDGSGFRVTGKGRRTRRVPLHPEIAAELAAEHARRQAGRMGSGFRYQAGADVFVFPGRSGGGATPNFVSNALSVALGPGVTGHQLRHRFATRALGASGNLAAVQDLLGHASPATTRVYAAVSDDALAEIVASI